MGSPPTPKKRPGRRGRFLTPSLAPRARARSKRRGATWTPTRSRWSTTRRGASESNLVLSCGATRLVTSGYVSFDFAPSATGIVGRDPAKIEMVNGDTKSCCVLLYASVPYDESLFPLRLDRPPPSLRSPSGASAAAPLSSGRRASWKARPSHHQTPHRLPEPRPALRPRPRRRR